MEVGKCYVGLGYDLGLTNRLRVDDDAVKGEKYDDPEDYAIRTRSLTFNIGYRF